MIHLPSKKTSVIIVTFLVLAWFVFADINAAVKTNIKGVVLDNETNEPVPGAVIRIVENNKLFTTDDAGEFLITSLDYGSYTIELHHLAYYETVVKLNITGEETESFAFYLVPKSIEINPVTVTDFISYSKFDDLQEISSVLKGKALQKELGLTLASTLKNETGLAIRSMGPAPARPVIRGLGSDRVFISEDGIKAVDLSASSPDHAVTIDPFNLQRIEVLRGPKVLSKISTTIGGVVNVIRNEIPIINHDHIFGSVGAYGETVNNGYQGSVLVEAPVRNFSIRGEVSRRKSFNLYTPKEVLGNSYSENSNYSFGTSYFTDFGFIGSSFREFELDYGVPGGFVGAHPKGVDISMFRRQYNLKSQLKLGENLERLDLDFTRVLYRHKEFEASGSIGAEFRIVEFLGSANINHKNLCIFNSGQFGISFEYRDFNIGGFVFTTPAKAFNLAGYFYEAFSYDLFNFELSARYSFDSIDPFNKKIDDKIGEIKKRTFNTYSLSFSTLYELTEIVYIGFNISKSSRVPTIEELFSRGPHLAAYSYEIGNPALEDERGLGLEAFVYHKFRDLYWNFNIFRNDLSYYIIPRKTGEINLQTFLPVYQTFGVPALLYGIENQLDWKITGALSLTNTISYTRGNFKGSVKSLPQIPPLKGKVGITYYYSDLAAGIETEWAASQRNVDINEQPTPGYSIYNVFAQYSISGEHLVHNLSVNIDNIFNTEYYNHLSRVKSILPEAGRNFRLTYKMYFNY
jgi:iron complex outermembrane receptor protein